MHDDDDAGSAEAHDSVAGSAKFTLKKDGVEFEDEEYCTGKALHSTSDGAREQPLG